uniref:RING-type domain-containing protein n=1 Tax=Syphacia muris TaxID=451379 RepID=A0A0N5A9W5_9BILA
MIEKGSRTLSSDNNPTTTLKLYSYETQRQFAEMINVDTGVIRQEWLSELICTVCNQTLKRTKVTPCLHRFCATCVNGCKRCPKCSEPIFKKSLLKNDTNTDAIIDKFLISPKRERVRRRVTELGHIYFSNRRNSKRWQNGYVKILKNLPTTSSPSQRNRPSKHLIGSSEADSEGNSKIDDAIFMRNGSEIFNESDVAVTSSVSDVNAKRISHQIHNKNYTVSSTTNGMSPVDSLHTPVVTLQKKTPNTQDSEGQKLNVLGHNTTEATDTTRKHAQVSSGYSVSDTPTVSLASDVVLPKKGDKIAGSAELRPPSIFDGLDTSISAEEMFFLLRQHLYPDCETEVILSPHASVFSDHDIPNSARRPHFIFCEPQAKVEHLCAYVVQRTKLLLKEKNTTFKKKVEICAVKMELSAKDVFVMNMAGEGRYSKMEICSPAEAESVRLFSIQYPFKDLYKHFIALEEERTVESLKEQFVGETIKPLRLVYRFVDDLD